jgi:MFS family permease
MNDSLEAGSRSRHDPAGPPIPPSTTLLVLLLTAAIMLLGSGLLSTLIGVRAILEEMPTSLAGLIMSAYFAGFILGTHLCVIITSQVGHIRAFASFAAILTTMVLAHSLWVGILPWIVFRFVSGIALAGLALIIESWLNAQARPERRGRVFSIYMVVNLTAVAGGQLLLYTADPAGFALFVTVAMLFSLSLVPTSLVRVEAPAPQQPSGLGLRKLAMRSPVAVAGCLCAGLAGGSFWGMAPVYLTLAGYPKENVSLFMVATIAGGMLSQLPIGRFSDGRDRRRVIAAVATLASAAAAGVMLASFASFGMLAAAASVFGAFMFPIYGLSVARAHDLLRPHEALEATRGLLMVFGMGAAFGPFTAGLIMAATGPWALFGWIAVVYALLAAFSMYRLAFSEAIPPEEQSHFVPGIITSTTTQAALPLAEADAYESRPGSES